MNAWRDYLAVAGIATLIVIAWGALIACAVGLLSWRFDDAAPVTSAVVGALTGAGASYLVVIALFWLFDEVLQ